MLLEYPLLSLKIEKNVGFHLVPQIANLLGLKEKFEQYYQDIQAVPIIRILRTPILIISIQLSFKAGNQRGFRRY